MQIAIIDDGVDNTKLTYQNLKRDLFVDQKNVVRERRYDNRLHTPHGTTCARIIEKYVPKAEFISIRVFHHEILKTGTERLCAALDWCLKERVPIIHMSLGTELLQDYIKLQPIIARMIKQGQVIVAAASNKGRYTIPACLGGVLGVAADKRLKELSYKSCGFEKGIMFSASSRHKLVDSSGCVIETVITNSYAAPTVTAAVHTILEKYEPYVLSVSEIYNKLMGEDLMLCPLKPDFIENAILLNLSGRKLLHQKFFFSLLSEYTSYDSFVNKLGEKSSIVFLPSLNQDENRTVLEFIKKNSKIVKGLLYAGKLDRTYLDSMKQNLIWNENDCGVLRWNQQEYQSGKEKCPDIFIFDDGLKGMSLTCDLQKLFLAEGYQCFIASNQRFTYLYGGEYFPRNLSLDEIIGYMNDQFEPDIVILNLEIYECNKIITRNKNNYIVTFGEESDEKENGNHTAMDLNYGWNDIYKLYKKIVEYYI